MRICLLLLIAACVSAQTVTMVCDGDDGDCPNGTATTLRARGFQTSLPLDQANPGCVLYMGGTDTNNGIYSNAIFRYCTTPPAFTKLVDNGATDTANCPQSGAPYDTWNPTLGHPQGSPWTDGTYAYITGQLCQGQFPGFTYRMALASGTMTTLLSVAPFGTGDGTYNATFVNFQAFAHSLSTGKSYYGIFDGGASCKFVEFDGAIWTDKTGSLTGDSLVCIRTAFWMGVIGTKLYVFGGCNGTSPGNNGTCSGTPLNSLHVIDLLTYEVTALSPSGTPPTTTYSSFPMMWVDTHRNRICDYSDTNTLSCYSPLANVWTTHALSGGLTMPTGSNGSGNMAQYDAVHDTAVVFTIMSQSTTPQVMHIDFGGVFASQISGAVTISGGATIR